MNRLAEWWRWLRSQADGRDAVTGIGLLMLGAGFWFSEQALIVVGAVLLYLGLWHPLLVWVVTSKRGE